MKSIIGSASLAEHVISNQGVTAVRPGILLGGKYRLDRPIGKGGMGCVWEAQQVHWAAPVAVKLLHHRSASTAGEADADDRQSSVRRFEIEARAVAAIRSPHIVQVLDHGVDPDLDLPYMVMELLEGETLEAKLRRCGRLTFEDTVRILSQVARGLTRVHDARLVHRDLKPGNIFLVRNDGEELVKLLDFGIAKTDAMALGEEPITVTGQQLGTPYYMSPEQVRGVREIDFRADLWAFGVIAYECVVGARPFEGQTLGALSLQICAEPLPRPSRSAPSPEAFDRWFWRCVNREREFTFQSASQAAAQLESALLGSGRRPSEPGILSAGDSTVHSSSHAMGATLAAGSADKPDLAVQPHRPRIGKWALGMLAVVVIVDAILTVRGQRSSEPSSAPSASAPVVTAPPLATGMQAVPAAVSSAVAQQLSTAQLEHVSSLLEAARAVPTAPHSSSPAAGQKVPLEHRANSVRAAPKAPNGGSSPAGEASVAPASRHSPSDLIEERL